MACVSIISLTDVDDGMLGVSAHCWCCPHFCMCNNSCALFVLFNTCSPFWLEYFVSICIIVLYVVLDYCIRYSYNITWLIILHGIYIIWNCGVYFCGGFYSSVYVPPPMCIFHSPCSAYPCGIYLLSVLFILCVCLFLYTHISLVLLSANCVTFIHDWMKTLGGGCICVISYAAKCVF